MSEFGSYVTVAPERGSWDVRRPGPGRATPDAVHVGYVPQPFSLSLQQPHPYMGACRFR
jgi:hypothetical protein